MNARVIAEACNSSYFAIFMYCAIVQIYCFIVIFVKLRL